MKVLVLAALFAVIDGNISKSSRDLECLLMNNVGNIVLFLKGDQVFLDNFETGNLTNWGDKKCFVLSVDEL